MTALPYTDVRKTIEQLREERRQLEAFMHGYANGMQDSEAGRTFDGPEDFEDRVTELFESGFKEDIR